MTVLKFKEAGVWKTLPLVINASVPMDPWHTVGAAGEPAFIPANGWSHYDVAQRPAQFRKDPLGRVWLRGYIKSGTTGVAAFTLPAGYFPSHVTQEFAVCANGSAGTAYVANDGRVVPLTGNNAYFDLDGMSFDTGTVTQMPTGPQGPQGPQGPAPTERYARRSHSLSVSLPNATIVDLPWNTSNSLSGMSWNGTATLLADVAGFYWVHAEIYTNMTSGSLMGRLARLTGGVFARQSTVGGGVTLGATIVQISTGVYLAAGDGMYVQGYAVGTGIATVAGEGHFVMYKVN